MEEYYDINKLDCELQSLSGYKIQQEMKILNDSILVLNANYFEVEQHLKNFQTKSLNTKVSLNPNLETKRLIHNYLASAISLIDHTRNYIKNIHKEKEFAEYQPMIQLTFIENPPCVFIKDFRQYMQHFKLPEITFIANAMSIKPKWSIKISNNELTKFSGWTKNSKIYIKSESPRLDLWEVIQVYQEIVREFYDWLKSKQLQIFSEEFHKVEEFKLEIKNSKIHNLINDVILKKFHSFNSYEREFCSIFSLTNLNNIHTLNSSEKIEKMILMLNIKDVLKDVIKKYLESIIPS